MLHQTAFSFHLQIHNKAVQELCTQPLQAGSSDPSWFYALVGKSISRLLHLDDTEADVKVSVNVIFSPLITIFVSSDIAEGKF